MSRERYGVGPDEHSALIEFDRELQDALSVSPSPDFETRVLRTIADRSAMRSPRWWVHAPFAAAAVVVLAASLTVLLQRQGDEQQLPSSIPSAASESERGPGLNHPSRGGSRTAPTTAGAAATPPAAAPSAPRSSPGAAHTVRRITRPRPPAAPEPEVIVPPDQAQAIRRLVRAVAEGKLQPPAIDEGVVTGTSDPVPVRQLTVEPIPVSAVEEQGRPAPGVDSRSRSTQ